GAVAPAALLVVGSTRQQARHRAGGGPAREPVHLAGDELRLLVLVVGVEDGDRGAGAAIGPQLLVLATGVPADHRVGGIQDRLGGPIVLLELDDVRVWVVRLEVNDVAQVGAAPRV